MNMDRGSARKVFVGAILLICGGLTMVAGIDVSLYVFFGGIAIVLVGGAIVCRQVFD